MISAAAHLQWKNGFVGSSMKTTMAAKKESGVTACEKLSRYMVERPQPLPFQ